MSPENYHHPRWFGSLANSMGAQFYAGYPAGRDPQKDARVNWDCCRVKARSAPVFASPESVLAVLERAVTQQAQCYRGGAEYLTME